MNHASRTATAEEVNAVGTVRIELTGEELDLLRELLENANTDLREEIYKTEGTDWKRALKTREQILAALLAKLPAGML